MYKIGKYKKTDGMSVLINDNYTILLVMSRFGIALGFGDQSIDEVCRNNNVDTDTFLSVVNISQLEHSFKADEIPQISISDLISYLKKSHTYFLDYKLPEIRLKLIQAIDFSDTELVVSILHYYDEYVQEVGKHMSYEEEVVFPYVNDILNDNVKDSYNIDIFSSRHDKIESKLSELKNIIIKYYRAKSNNSLNNALFNIFLCEKDLAFHNEVENKLFIPIIRQIEKNKKK